MKLLTKVPEEAMLKFERRYPPDSWMCVGLVEGGAKQNEPVHMAFNS